MYENGKIFFERALITRFILVENTQVCDVISLMQQVIAP